MAQFSKHYADYQRTQTQNYQVNGTDLANTIIIAIRSTDKVDKALKAQFKNSEDVYDIVDISKGTTGKPIDYDLVTLKLQKGV
ncbi:putative phage head-tail adaptor [Paucilactobacillus vaccinostercus DSM 20634]|uniref:Putative phage head-tail adaptor n=1 Tax=Paucilactobacillus vaccinostercus DSM 20634 TaxID=1423813 RepID=A0A0R2A627_9LACO|nr:putative phage head-tail adaptor [Paucilactobacillus vaccinostercus DSM 20634]